MPQSVFKLLEEGIKARTSEHDLLEGSGVVCKPTFEWESIPKEDRGMLLTEELMANYVLNVIYHKVDEHSYPNRGKSETYTFPSHQAYPKAQILEQLRRTKSTIQNCFKVEGDKVVFPALSPAPEQYELRYMVESLLGKTPGGFSKIDASPAHGILGCSISLKNAKELLAPYLELDLGMGQKK